MVFRSRAEITFRLTPYLLRIFVFMLRTLFLASRSPRRAALVQLLGVQRIEIHPADLEEEMDASLGAAENVRRLALDKARWVARELNSKRGVVLGADTTVAINDEILEKPLDTKDAERMLALLSNNTHTVHTGVALIDIETKAEQSFVESTDVTFRSLSLDDIRDYIATGSPMDKAGAYGIQEDFGAVFVSRIDGDYYNVVGLPLSRLYTMLKEFAPDLFYPPLLKKEGEGGGPA
ncbi:MAG TPA: Maf family protein [Candidatus Kapabacteria bacterium]|nr:Maf family protein [Candidatus Kapabacteria bacterium]